MNTSFQISKLSLFSEPHTFALWVLHWNARN